MNETYDDKLCLERHKRIDEKLETHEKRLNAHSSQIDALMENKAESKTQIDNLCKSLDALNGRLDKIVTQNASMQKIFITAILGFCLFVFEKKLFP